MSSFNDSTERAGVIFDDAGISTPDASEVRQRYVVGWKGIYGDNLDTRAATPQGQIIDFCTAVTFEKNGQLAFLASMFNVDTAEGIWQDALYNIYMLQRLPAAPSLTYQTDLGLAGLTRKADETQIIDRMGNIWALSYDVTFPESGVLEGVEYYCVTAGPVTANAGAIDRIYRGPASGWDSTTNPEPPVVGTLDESRYAFNQRYKRSVAKNGRGTRSAAWGALENIENVISVWVEENYFSWQELRRGVWVYPHTLFISILGGDQQQIARTIYAKKDAGCGLQGNTRLYIKIPRNDDNTDFTEHLVIFNRPGVLPCRVQVTVRGVESIAQPGVAALIKQRVMDTWHGVYNGIREDIGGTVYASRYYCPVTNLQSDRNFEVVQVKVSRPENVIISDDTAFEYVPDLHGIRPKAVGPDLDHPIFEYVEINGEAGLRVKASANPDDTRGFFEYDIDRQAAKLKSNISDIGDYLGWVDFFETTLNEYPSLSIEDVFVEFI